MPNPASYPNLTELPLYIVPLFLLKSLAETSLQFLYLRLSAALLAEARHGPGLTRLLRSLRHRCTCVIKKGLRVRVHCGSPSRGPPLLFLALDPTAPQILLRAVSLLART